MGMVILFIALFGFGIGFSAGFNGVLQACSQQNVSKWIGMPLAIFVGLVLGCIGGGLCGWIVMRRMFP